MARRKEGEILPTPVLWDYTANKAGLHPVKLRLIHQRVPKYYPIMSAAKEKLFLSKSDYDYIVTTPLQKLRGKNRKTREIIEDSKQAAKDAIRECTNGGKTPFSFHQFDRKYLGEDASHNFLAYFKAHIDKLDRRGQAGTVRTYLTVYNTLTEFQNNRDFDPADLTPQKLEAFDEWLRKPRPKRKPLNDTSVSVYMRCLRSVYNEMAVDDEYLQALYPFSRKESDKKYKIPVGGGQKGTTLSKEDMVTFIEGNIKGEAIPENPMYRAKQMFLFSFFGQGANFKDLALLRYENVAKDHIEFERQKTIRTKSDARKIQIPLTDELREILVEQGNPDKRKENYIFNVFESGRNYTPKEMDDRIRQWIKTTNKWLKRYCEINGLPAISTYTARHTFASLSKSYLPLAMISKMLGHSRITTTQSYLGRFDNEENRSGLMKVFSAIKKKIV